MMKLFTTVVLVCLGASSIVHVECLANPGVQLSSTHLRQAYNAALMQWLDEDNYQTLETKHNGNHVATWDCNPRGLWNYPDRTLIPTTDRLYNVLETKKITYAGLGKNWGSDYSYDTDPPQGFWPELMGGILKNLGAHYGIELQHVRKSFTNSHSLLEALDAGVNAGDDEFDMTEAYYILSGLDKDNLPRKERFAAGCASLGSETQIVVKSTSSITTMADIAAIEKAQNLTIGTLSTGNFHAISPAAPRHATSRVYDSDAELVQGIKAGEVDAGVTTGELDNSLKGGLRIFPSGSITLHAAFFRKNRVEEICAVEEKSTSASTTTRLTVAAVPILLLAYVL